MSLKPYSVVALAKIDTGGYNIVQNAKVEIKDYPGNSVYQAIYSDAAGVTEITQPAYTDTNGKLNFWIEEGEYYRVINDSIIDVISIGSGSAATAAASVSVTDVGAYFTGDDVEDVLQEIGAAIVAIGSPVLVDGLSGFIKEVADGDIKVAIQMPFAGTITQTTTQCVSGSCTATFKINSTALGGTPNSVSSTEQDQAHSTDNVFAAGDNIVLTISANSSCLMFSFMIKFTRTLA